MTSFANILLAVLWLSGPSDGSTVPTLRDAQKAYLAKPRAERFRLMGDAAARRCLADAGSTQRPVELSWFGDTNAVYELEVIRDGGDRQVFAVTNRTEAYLSNFEIGAKYLWSVTRADDPNETTNAVFVTEADPPRLLLAGGVLNLRDLGGWKAAGGRRVRQGLVFRSAGLRDNAHRKSGSLFGGRVEAGERRITAAGIAVLRDDLKIRTDLELRNNQEAAAMTSSVLGPDVKWVHVPFAAYDFIDNPARGREPFLKVFRTFLDRKSYPILFHCSGGRDRTGTLAFLLNGLLGVGDDDLCRDWEATVFCEDSLKFGPSRLERLLRYLKGLGGATMAEQCERYALSCGITKDEIRKFREVMLEDGN